MASEPLRAQEPNASLAQLVELRNYIIRRLRVRVARGAPKLLLPICRRVSLLLEVDDPLRRLALHGTHRVPIRDLLTAHLAVTNQPVIERRRQAVVLADVRARLHNQDVIDTDLAFAPTLRVPPVRNTSRCVCVGARRLSFRPSCVRALSPRSPCHATQSRQTPVPALASFSRRRLRLRERVETAGRESDPLSS